MVYHEYQEKHLTSLYFIIYIKRPKTSRFQGEIRHSWGDFGPPYKMHVNGSYAIPQSSRTFLGCIRTFLSKNIIYIYKIPDISFSKTVRGCYLEILFSCVSNGIVLTLKASQISDLIFKAPKIVTNLSTIHGSSSVERTVCPPHDFVCFLLTAS